MIPNSFADFLPASSKETRRYNEHRASDHQGSRKMSRRILTAWVCGSNAVILTSPPWRPISLCGTLPQQSMAAPGILGASRAIPTRSDESVLAAFISGAGLGN
jgi:hypothetical protein